MRYFLTALGLELRARARSPRFWLILLLALTAGLAFRRLTPAEGASLSPIQVGVALPEEGGEAFWDALSQRSGELLSFVPAGESQLRRMVASGRWDCGLVLPEDFAIRLAAGDQEELVTLVTGPASTVYPLVRETAAAALSALLWPRIAEEYLEQWDLALGTPPEIPPVSIALETLDGGALSLPALARRGSGRLFQAVTAALALVWALFAAVDLGRWRRSPAAARLRPCVGGTVLCLPRLAAELLQALLIGGGALLAALGREAGLASLLCYVLFLSGLILLLSPWGTGRLLPALPPFVGMGALALSPAAADIGALFPRLAPIVRNLPTAWYLEACGGDRAAMGRLLALAAACCGLAAALSWRRKR